MRNGPKCPVSSTKFKQGKGSVEKGSPAGVPSSEGSHALISNSSFVWCPVRFLYPDQCTRVRSVLGKSCESIRWGRTTVKGQVEGRTVDLLGWFQDNQFQGRVHRRG